VRIIIQYEYTQRSENHSSQWPRLRLNLHPLVSCSVWLLGRELVLAKTTVHEVESARLQNPEISERRRALPEPAVAVI